MPEITDDLAQRLYESVATDLLPDLPTADGCDSGYEWIEELVRTRWAPVAADHTGRLLGDWPYQVVAHHNDDDRSLYGLAVYTEGDVSVEGFRDKAARDKATDAYLDVDEEATP
jgi:hypothetical protein